MEHLKNPLKERVLTGLKTETVRFFLKPRSEGHFRCYSTRVPLKK